MPKISHGQVFDLPFLIQQFRESLRTHNVARKQPSRAHPGRQPLDPTWYQIQINVATIIGDMYHKPGLKTLARLVPMPYAVLRDYALIGSTLTPEVHASMPTRPMAI